MQATVTDASLKAASSFRRALAIATSLLEYRSFTLGVYETARR